MQTHSPVWQRIFYPLYIFGQLFSDLASENTELLAKPGLEKLIHTPGVGCNLQTFNGKITQTNSRQQLRLHFLHASLGLTMSRRKSYIFFG
jgi:hypothetical protein